MRRLRYVKEPGAVDSRSLWNATALPKCPNMFFALHNLGIFSIPPTSRGEIYVAIRP